MFRKLRFQMIDDKGSWRAAIFSPIYDRFDFINSGSKTILRTTDLKPAVPPPDFKSPSVKGKSRSPRIKLGV
jgi:hypothetical protein